MVFQSYALYPHMTVAQNIGFPLKMVGTPTRRRSSARSRDAAAQGRHRPPARRARPGSSPAASSSAARWRARSCASRGCSCSTSRCRTSTPSCASRRALELHKLQRSLGVDHRLRHARPGRGDDARRPHRRVHGRPHRAGRHAARDLRAARRRVDVAGFIGTPPMNLLPAHVARRAPSAIDGAALAASRGVDRAPREVTLGVRPGDLRIAADGLPRARRAHRGPGRQQHRRASSPASGSLKLKSDRLPDVREGDACTSASRPTPRTCSTARAAHDSDLTTIGATMTDDPANRTSS